MKSRSEILLRGSGQCRLDSERGAFMVIFALMLLVILGFVALGVEAGRWYLVRAELAKGVDAAALVAAKNISNPYVSPTVLAEEFGVENFHAGYIGTPGAGTGTVKFTATMVESDKVRVTGDVRATAVLAKLFGINTIPVNAVSMAQKKEVEIMMILDRSGSMKGQKIADLQAAAKSFIDYFKDTEDKDKVGLITFAQTVVLDPPLDTYFVSKVESKIKAMSALGGTNYAEALLKSIDTGGFTDQTGVPGDKRIQQFVVFFTDGLPTAFRGKFVYQGNTIDAVATVPGNCPIPPSTAYPNVYPTLQSISTEGTNLGVPHPYPAGDGSNTKKCISSLQGNDLFVTTMWNRFTIVPPTTPYSAGQCVDDAVLGKYVCTQARQMASDNAQLLKNRGIKVYTIGLGSGSEIDPAYLESLSSGSNYTYITPNSNELESIFNKIAKEIKLRLVQ